MTYQVNGGVITSQTLAGSLRFFKITGPFAWTVSDGSVNLPVPVTGGSTTTTTYFTVGQDFPVPNSAADQALRQISEQCDIVMISLQPGSYGTTAAIHIACSATGFGWGSDSPTYGSNTVDMNLAAAATEMQAAINALGTVTVYVSVGTADQTKAPVTSSVNMVTVTVTEVPFALA